MEWVQVYDPLGSPWLSTLLAAAPIVVLLGLLVIGQSAPRAAIIGLAAALLVAIAGFGMPVGAALAAAAYGACFGLLPIGWIVLAAVFLFHLTVRAGQFEVVKQSVAAISPDRRMQALLIAFSFGSFVEGAAGFGTPVAISAALLIGLGFSPLYAAGLALLANTSPVAFGALGTPIITLAKISGLDEMALSQMAGRQLPLFSLIVPAWLVVTMSGWRGLAAAGPPSWSAAAALPRSSSSLPIFTGRRWSTSSAGWARSWRWPCFCASGSRNKSGAFPTSRPHPTRTPRRRWRAATSSYAWMPWALLSLLMFVWGTPLVRSAARRRRREEPQRAARHQQARFRGALPARQGVSHPAGRPGRKRLGPRREAETAIYEFNWLSATGTGIFLAAVLTGLLAADFAHGLRGRSSSTPSSRCAGPC